MTYTFLKINEDGTLEEVTGSDSLRTLQKCVGGLIQTVDLKRPDLDLWVNEEGLINGLLPNFPATFLLWSLNDAHHRNGTVLYGPAVLSSSTPSGFTGSVDPGWVSRVRSIWRCHDE